MISAEATASNKFHKFLRLLAFCLVSYDIYIKYEGRSVGGQE